MVGVVEHDAFILTLLYVIRDLGDSHGVDPWPLYWGLVWAGTLGSNLTIAGAPALYVALTMGEKEDGRNWSLKEFLSYSVPYVMISLLCALFSWWSFGSCRSRDPSSCFSILEPQTMHKYRHILVAIDFSDISDAVTARAFDLAAHYGAEVTLVHVIEHFPDHLPHYKMSGEDKDPKEFPDRPRRKGAGVCQ